MNVVDFSTAPLICPPPSAKNWGTSPPARAARAAAALVFLAVGGCCCLLALARRVLACLLLACLLLLLLLLAPWLAFQPQIRRQRTGPVLSLPPPPAADRVHVPPCPVRLCRVSGCRNSGRLLPSISDAHACLRCSASAPSSSAHDPHDPTRRTRRTCPSSRTRNTTHYQPRRQAEGMVDFDDGVWIHATPEDLAPAAASAVPPPPEAWGGVCGRGRSWGRSGDCVLAAVDRADALAWAQRDVADAPPLHRRCSGVKGSQGNCAHLPFCVCYALAGAATTSVA